MIELERGDKKKGRVKFLTRPEPTIIGNCEGWNFIVGKKPKTYSPKKSNHESLQDCNKKFIHNLLTIVRDY